jgi:hypothetical protein
MEDSEATESMFLSPKPRLSNPVFKRFDINESSEDVLIYEDEYETIYRCT